jgi:hypothetical protein
LFEDLQDRQASQTGKQPEGGMSDLDIAFYYTMRDIEASQMSLRDEVLAQSTSSAILSDANEAAPIEAEERMTGQDDQVSPTIADQEAMAAQDPDADPLAEAEGAPAAPRLRPLPRGLQNVPVHNVGPIYDGESDESEDDTADDGTGEERDGGYRTGDDNGDDDGTGDEGAGGHGTGGYYTDVDDDSDDFGTGGYRTDDNADCYGTWA